MKKVVLSFLLLSSSLFAVDLSTLPPPYSELKELYPFDGSGWFGDSNQIVLRQLIREYDITVVVELGSLLGLSTRFIAQLLPEKGKVYAVDHWLGNLEHQNPNRVDIYPKLTTLFDRFLSNVIHTGLCNKIVPIKATTLEAVNLIPEQPDLVYVDASHDYQSVLDDLEAWFPRIRKGGILCGDDWTWGATLPVRRAVQFFANKYGLECHAQGGFWWIISPS